MSAINTVDLIKCETTEKFVEGLKERFESWYFPAIELMIEDNKKHNNYNMPLLNLVYNLIECFTIIPKFNMNIPYGFSRPYLKGYAVDGEDTGAIDYTDGTLVINPTKLYEKVKKQFYVAIKDISDDDRFEMQRYMDHDI